MMMHTFTQQIAYPCVLQASCDGTSTSNVAIYVMKRDYLVQCVVLLLREASNISLTIVQTPGGQVNVGDMNLDRIDSLHWL
jgi:hypothetical protein